MLKYIIPVILFLAIGHGCTDPQMKRKSSFQTPEIKTSAINSH
jgi:hypothetical protein